MRKTYSQTFLAVILLAAVLAGCTAAQPTTAPTATAAPQPTETVPPPTSTPAGNTYTNPVFAEDFPDPHIILAGDTYYGYATNAAGANIQLIKSTDLVTWERVGDAVPVLPGWAKPNQGLTWAPGVIQIGDTFVMYHVARDAKSDYQCIAMAVSSSPEGPFTDKADAPFVCQVDLGGSIDPYPYRDEDGKLYLFWKNDGNCCGKRVALWVQPLSEDGQKLTGEPTELIRRDQAWEQPLIENPAVVKSEGKYYLFYSGNWWESHEYAVGYAVCESITGPCKKPLKKPIFQFTSEVMGPGGESFFTDKKGNLWIAYHAWTGIDIGYPQGKRSLRIEPAAIKDGQPVIAGPSHTAQPLP